MCGIIAAFKTTKTKTPVNTSIIDQYQNQYSRGEEGFGIIRIDPKQNIEIDRACEPSKFLIDLYLKPSNMIIIHHRHPTSTHNKLDQTHPLTISHKSLKHDYQIIHNGIISNDDELHKKHLKLNFKYKTEYIDYTYYHPEGITKWNDSEALAIELALFIEKQTNIIDTKNNAAFIILQIDKKTKKAKQVFFGKNDSTSALNMYKLKQQLFLSSEGKGKAIKENILYSFKINNQSIKLKQTKIPFQKTIPITTITSNDSYHNYYNNYDHNKSKPIQKTTKIKEKTKKEKETNSTTPIPYDKTLRAYREWITDPIEEEDEKTPETTIIDKHYITQICNILITEIKTCTPSDITHKIDDSLDNQIDIIISILNDYKETLLLDQLKKEDIPHFTKQIEILMQTMSIITHLAEKTYKEKTLQEELKNINDPFDFNFDPEKKTVKPITNEKLMGF